MSLIAKPGDRNTGVGRYASMLEQGLMQRAIPFVRSNPIVLPLPQMWYSLALRAGIDVQTFLLNYPLLAAYPRANLYHITSQNLATLLLFRRPSGPTVVTVHDIIPYMVRKDPQLCVYRTAADRLFDRLAMVGLYKADALLADSHYTKRCMVAQLGISAERITVVYLGVDAQHFRPLTIPTEIYTHYDLPTQRRYLIYVGSEDPRKNLTTLLFALAQVRAWHIDVHLLKVGPAHFADERQKLVSLADELGLTESIHWLDAVPETDLPFLYNLATLCVMPSRYEGFGFPVLEAMACGTPVVAADASSLPELIGQSGILYTAYSPEACARAINYLLTNNQVAEALGYAARQRALTFNWGQTISNTLTVYAKAAQRDYTYSTPK